MFIASSPIQAILSTLQDDVNIAKAYFERLDEHDEDFARKTLVLESGLARLGKKLPSGSNIPLRMRESTTNACVSILKVPCESGRAKRSC